MINASKQPFKISSYDANHGHWMDHPANKISSVYDILAMLRSEVGTLNPGKVVIEAELMAARCEPVQLDHTK